MAAPSTDNPQLLYDEALPGYRCEGTWSITLLPNIFDQFKSLPPPEAKKLIINCEQLDYLDSAGALGLYQCILALQEQGKTVELTALKDHHASLFKLVEDKEKNGASKPPSSAPPPPFLYRLGKETVDKIHETDGFIILIGDLSIKLFQAIGQWRRFQLPSILSIIYSAGIQSLPIVGLLAFLIGVVLAYQMGLQLQTYGANIFIAYLSGLAIFREFGPLITAIIVAGRTSSAFTAQIGNMKINEEVDAISTMGLSPTELLVMPKVLGLILVFPLLIFWADLFSILGSMFMSKWVLDVSYLDFLVRLKNSVGLQHLLLGLYKAPVFALLIALVGCFQGFRVSSNSTSIGSQTTKSVVQSLFLIIVADAIFSIIYSWMDL